MLHAGEPDALLAPEIAWAALDCPSYTPDLWDARAPEPAGAADRRAARARPAGEPLVVIGWALGADGRKHHSASALLGADGRMLARARALWIQLQGGQPTLLRAPRSGLGSLEHRGDGR